MAHVVRFIREGIRSLFEVAMGDLCVRCRQQTRKKRLQPPTRRYSTLRAVR